VGERRVACGPYGLSYTFEQPIRHLLPKSHATDPKKYYILYNRVLGLRQRGRGKLYLAKLKDHVLLSPKSRPPPESLNELLEADLLKHVQKGSTLHTDGAQAYPNP